MTGLELVAKEVPDLILLDLVMPEMHGIQFLQLLREAHPELPVVIVTGYPDSELMKQASQYAPVMLLVKPVDAALLERTVRSVLGEKLVSVAGAEVCHDHRTIGHCEVMVAEGRGWKEQGGIAGVGICRINVGR